MRRRSGGGGRVVCGDDRAKKRSCELVRGGDAPGERSGFVDVGGVVPVPAGVPREKPVRAGAVHRRIDGQRAADSSVEQVHRRMCLRGFEDHLETSFFQDPGLGLEAFGDQDDSRGGAPERTELEKVSPLERSGHWIGVHPRDCLFSGDEGFALFRSNNDRAEELVRASIAQNEPHVVPLAPVSIEGTIYGIEHPGERSTRGESVNEEGLCLRRVERCSFERHEEL